MLNPGTDIEFIEKAFNEDFDILDNNSFKDFYVESISADMDYIKFIHSENKIFQRIREKNQGNWEINELCREILFDNVKLLNFLKNRIENAKEDIKKLS